MKVIFKDSVYAMRAPVSNISDFNKFCKDHNIGLNWYANEKLFEIWFGADHMVYIEAGNWLVVAISEKPLVFTDEEFRKIFLEINDE